MKLKKILGCVIIAVVIGGLLWMTGVMIPVLLEVLCSVFGIALGISGLICLLSWCFT